MTNIRKAAIVLMSLPQEDAVNVMGKLTPEQVEAVSIEIAKIGRLSGPDQEDAIICFADANPNALGGSAGGLDVAKMLVQQALGKDADKTLENVLQSVEALPFGFLKSVDPQNLLTIINQEHPQTLALILSHLPPAYASQIIAGLTAERQLAVISRIASMEQTSPEIIEEVEAGLESRMASVVSQSYQDAGGISTVAEVLNVIDRATERSILDNLAQDDPDMVDQIRRLMFVFDDIAKLSDKDIQSVLKGVESSQWAMALKGSSEDLKEKILGNMSQRAAQMLSEEMDFLGAVRLSEVEAVQQQIVDVVRRLEDSGQLSTHGSEESEQFIS